MGTQVFKINTMTIPVIFVIIMLIRFISLFKSISNEKALKKGGAVEYGKRNSLVLVLGHVLYYFACMAEAILFEKTVNNYTLAGVLVFTFSMIILWIVIASLKEVWTVKLIIAPKHHINKSFIFKYFRHPNYFLNVIPELIGVALICQSWYTLLIGLPLYCIPLSIRIMQEEKIMKAHFSDY
jgi:isoprenylcysteine carboxyl methyltransferase (ICMT) family protein YpbQ